MGGRFRVDVNHREHPDLEARKELAVRALATVHLDLRPEARMVTELAVLANAVRAFARRDARLAQPHTQFLGQAVLEVQGMFASRGAELSGFRTYLDDFIKEATAIGCANCTAGKYCSGSPLRDADVVADPESKTLCLDFIFQMFGKLTKLACQHYGRVLPPDTVPLTLRLSTTKSAGLNGETAFPPTDVSSDRRADIDIALPVEDLDGKFFVTLPYVLFHEIFVHGPEAWLAQGRRHVTPETCAFREGFVDAAAVYVLRTTLTSDQVFIAAPRDKQLNRLLALRIAAAQLVRATATSTGKADTSLAEAEAKLRSARQFGAMAFQEFSDREHGQFAASLAMALNVLDTTEERRAAYLPVLQEVARYIVPSRPEGYLSDQHIFAKKLFELGRQKQIDPPAIQSLIEEYIDVDNYDF